MNKKTQKRRGRPRQFDEDAVLDRALRLFWRRGLSGTSLDELADAMKMKRPSLQNAFGDKESLYRQVLARFVARMRAETGALLLKEPDLGMALRKFFDGAIRVYFSEQPPLGCFVMCTATLEAGAHPEVRRDLRQVIAELDELLTARFANAQKSGQWKSRSDPAIAAKLVQSTLHGVALRARAGESKAALRRMAHGAVDLLLAGSG